MHSVTAWGTDDVRTLDFSLYHSSRSVLCHLSRSGNEEKGLVISAPLADVIQGDTRSTETILLIEGTERSKEQPATLPNECFCKRVWPVAPDQRFNFPKQSIVFIVLQDAIPDEPSR